MAQRTVTKLTRFTPEEWEAVEEAAAACGRTPARYLREVALQMKPRAQRSQTDDDAVLALNRIGVNLNQIAKAANSNTLDAIDKRHVKAVLTAITEAIKRL